MPPAGALPNHDCSGVEMWSTSKKSRAPTPTTARVFPRMRRLSADLLENFPFLYREFVCRVGRSGGCSGPRRIALSRGNTCAVYLEVCGGVGGDYSGGGQQTRRRRQAGGGEPNAFGPAKRATCARDKKDLRKTKTPQAVKRLNGPVGGRGWRCGGTVLVWRLAVSRRQLRRIAPLRHCATQKQKHRTRKSSDGNGILLSVSSDQYSSTSTS